MFAEEQIHSTEVTLLVHEFCSSEGLRHRRKQQVLNDGLRLVASEIVGQPISFCDIHESKTGAVVCSISRILMKAGFSELVYLQQKASFCVFCWNGSSNQRMGFSSL